MKQRTVISISKELHVTRTRVYQIIRQLEKQGKIKKDADGKYILDDQAVNEITKIYKSNSKSFTAVQKLSKAERKIQTLNNEIKELQERQKDLLNQIEVSKSLAESRKETIESLKENRKNAEQFTQVMNKALDSLNKEQGLNYMDKVKKLPQDDKKQATVEDKKDNKKKHVTAWQRLKNVISPKN